MAVMGLLHLLRIIFGWQAEIGGLSIPIWAWYSAQRRGLVKGIRTLSWRRAGDDRRNCVRHRGIRGKAVPPSHTRHLENIWNENLVA